MKDLEKKSLLSTNPDIDDGEGGKGDFEPELGINHNNYKTLEHPYNRGIKYETLSPVDPDEMEAAHSKRKSMSLAWKDIEAYTPEKTVGVMKKTTIPSFKILKKVSGVVNPGTMVAIMGASGSGKTTLLNVLTGRNNSNINIRGQVLLNGKPAGDRISYCSGYIQQEDLFIGTLTVREHLWFTAKLRMDSNTTDQEKNEKIDEVIQELGLTKSENTLIGIPGMLKGISGGEKKRLAFAAELLRDPMMLFADEPTSGLDSFMAANVVETLIDLANRGRTVMCTIHQPASEVYALFPQVMLLAEGKTVYLGPTKGLPDFFAEAGYTIPSGFNPADFFIKNLAVVPGREQESRERIGMLTKAYDSSPQWQSIRWQLEHLQSRPRDTDEFLMEMEKAVESSGSSGSSDPAQRNYERQKTMEEEGGVMGRYMTGFWTQYYMLFWRCVKGFIRNKKIMPARIMQIIFTAIVLGLVYYQQNYDQTGVSNINGALFMLLVQLTFNTSFSIAVAFLSDYPVFLKEHKDKTYCVLSYYLSKTTCDMPALIFAAFCYVSIAYWMIGLNPNVEAFFFFFLGCALMASVAVGLGHMAGSICSSPQLALTLLPLMMGVFLLFSGFLVKEDTVLPIFLPIVYISPYRYTFKGLMILQWRDIDHISCSYSTDSSDWYNGTDTATTSSNCFSSGYDVLMDYGYNPGDIRSVFWVVLALLFSVEIIGYLFLWRKGAKA